MYCELLKCFFNRYGIRLYFPHKLTMTLMFALFTGLVTQQGMEEPGDDPSGHQMHRLL